MDYASYVVLSKILFFNGKILRRRCLLRMTGLENVILSEAKDLNDEGRNLGRFTPQNDTEGDALYTLNLSYHVSPGFSREGERDSQEKIKKEESM